MFIQVTKNVRSQKVFIQLTKSVYSQKCSFNSLEVVIQFKKMRTIN